MPNRDTSKDENALFCHSPTWSGNPEEKELDFRLHGNDIFVLNDHRGNRLLKRGAKIIAMKNFSFLRKKGRNDHSFNKADISKKERSGSKMAINDTSESNTDKINISNPYIVTLTDPHSPISEEYRNVKSMIIRLTQHGGLHNTLVVTSTLSGEGKSISSINLAITLSQEYDHTVLLVDADLRNPFLHNYLNINTKKGLADCLVDGTDIGSALIKTGIEKLSFLPAGKSVTNPVELLSSNKMKELIAEMKHRYADRYIIIDTPPVLPFAETRSISIEVDGIIFVVREGMVSLNSIQEALDILNRGNLLGILFNDVNIENLNGYYTYYYKRYTDYKKDVKKDYV